MRPPTRTSILGAPGFPGEHRETAYDELFGPGGELRPHWRQLDERLAQIGVTGLERRWEEASRLVRENGLTYNAFVDPQGQSRLWELDPMPGLVTESEWAALEQGLIQRATLLDRIAEDVYGPQELLWEGKIPSRLLYDHPGFLAPCQGLCLPGFSRLLFYAADLARARDGSWLALRDRTQCPTGFGYVLENRLVMARMFPEIFREGWIRPLSPFFQALRASLQQAGERVVLLTAGPSSRAYFEDAYLAQYLGCSLVEGADLTVRGTGVYLKMLDGLQQVDVIVRRVADEDCDPLELRGDSWHGVCGLTQAVRSGNVVVTNHLGSGWLEGPGLAPFLPDLCRELLGEDLLLPGPPSWWCGQPDGLERVLADFEQMVIRRAFPRPGRLRSPRVVARLEKDEKRRLLEEVRREPAEFVGQLSVALSCLPGWLDRRLQPGPVTFRGFVANGPEGFLALPGGIVRSHSPGRNLLGSKDLWWLRAPEEDPLPAPARASARALRLTRSGGDVPSRAADNFFWLGRYLERGDGLVHLARVCLGRLTQRNQAREPEEVRQLVESRCELDYSHKEAARNLLDWVADRKKPNALGTLLGRLQGLSGNLRDRLTTDAVSILRGLKQPPPELSDSQALEYLEQISMRLWSIAGMATESLHRGYGYRFLDLGRRLERALRTAELLTLVAPPQEDAGMLELLLEVCDSSRTYRRRYQASVQREAVLDLLLLDDTNPRSVFFQLQTMQAHVQVLPRDPEAAGLSPEQRILTALATRLQLFEIDQADQVEALLESLGDDLPRLSEAITQDYLTHLKVHRQLPALRTEEAHEV